MTVGSREQRDGERAGRTLTQRLTLSDHAFRRMRQRGLSEGDVHYVVQHGHKRHAADAVIYFLRDKDLPQQDCRLQERLRGTAVVVSRFQPHIITVWRNRQDGLRHIKRKPRSGRQGYLTPDGMEW